ncbi:hypothetical protein LINPERPRIM_LOCUS902 [Linum perenne]
MCSWLTL